MLAEQVGGSHPKLKKQVGAVRAASRALDVGEGRSRGVCECLGECHDAGPRR